MINLPFRHARFALMLMLAGTCLTVAQGQDLLVPSTVCTAGHGEASSFEQVAALVKAAQFEAAECRARDLAAAQPNSADAHYLLGNILSHQGKAEESLQEYTTGARYRRPAPNDLDVVALDYVLLKDYADAEKWMVEATDGDAGNALDWYYLGRIEYKLNTFDKARVAFEKALALEPGNTRDLDNLGLTYEGLGKPDQAMNFYHQAIASEQELPLKNAQPYYNLGSLLIRQNQPVEAQPLLERAAQLDPRNPAIHEQLAKAEEQTGHLDTSRKDFEAAVKLAPEVASLHFELGRVYQKLRMPAEAKQQFDLCATMTSTHSSTGEESLNFRRPQ